MSRHLVSLTDAQLREIRAAVGGEIESAGGGVTLQRALDALNSAVTLTKAERDSIFSAQARLEVEWAEEDIASDNRRWLAFLSASTKLLRLTR